MVECIRNYVQHIAVGAHDLAWGTGRLAKAIPPASEPFRFDLVARCIQKGLFVMFNEQGKGQHVTIDSLVTNSLAGLTLFVKEEAAPTLIWAGKASMWSGK